MLYWHSLNGAITWHFTFICTAFCPVCIIMAVLYISKRLFYLKNALTTILNLISVNDI